MTNYKELRELAQEDPDAVERQCQMLLDKNPDDPLALMLLGSIYSRAERYGIAYNLFKRVVETKPGRPEAWNNVGMALEGLKRNSEAREYFREAMKRDKNCANYPANIALTYLEQRDYAKALEWCEKAFRLDPEHKGAKTTYGMVQLALGHWSEAWPAMAYCVGGKFRKEVVFKDEVRWDGSPDKIVAVYGEQGIGDEVMYASCIPDAIEHCKEVILECDARLAGLFRRSFPRAHVYGTRRQDVVSWPAKHQIDARCAIGQLPQFFRPTRASCPGTPYLVADPDRRIQWRALFDSWGKKPKIGLAWSGGSRHNNPEARAIGLSTFSPLIDNLDADWVSLQYQDPSEEIAASGLPVKHYPRATLTHDYDDTAGMVAELDLVIGPHTSVHHLAGALGVSSLILVPQKTMWIYAQDDLPWYGTATLVRQAGTWKDTIEALASHPLLAGLAR